MATVVSDYLQQELNVRRVRLEAAIRTGGEEARLVSLIEEVDAALRRMTDGSYGMCEVCHETVEPDRLLCDPLLRTCLDHLTTGERRDLERDLSVYTSRTIDLDPGDGIVLYTDGLSEASNAAGDDYGMGRLTRMIEAHLEKPPRALVAACLGDFGAFRGPSPPIDDLTLLAIRRSR